MDIYFRDDLRSVAMTLRQLSKYLCSFLIAKQEELNSSIAKGIVGMEYGRMSNLKGDGDGFSSESIDNSEKPVNESKSPKRVHFVTNIEEIVSLIDEDSVLANFTNTECTNEATNQLRVDLNACLEKLKEEAAAISGT